ncbi:E3 ubiquitin-protein ligase TRIM39-like [Salminus brasiliensis]|uniref:E3 ubiquitin-protein ligase TRIM39-like n=1 Tax=Salminus brasiliensis TaxID=930266 RepID=UPI003B83080A
MAMASFRSPTPSDASLPDIPVSVSQYLKCPICLDKMTHPVTTPCGHTFCKPCLERHMTLSDLTCPLCKKYLLVTPSENIILKALLEEYEKAQKPCPEDFMATLGEVACDLCPENRKSRAVKSCLMCLLSYCDLHLKRHQNKLRLKGHKLVAPVEKLDDWACLTHGRPLELYWGKEDKCICSLCVDQAMEVVSVETERGRREVELGSVIKDMEQRIQHREEKEKELEHSAQNCLALIKREEEEVKEVFDAVRKAVAKAEEEALSPLKDKRRSVEREVEKFKQELQGEIARFSKTISDLKKITQEEDNIVFLQGYPPVPAPDNGKDWTDVAVDTDLTFGTMRNTQTTMMADIETELEKLSSIEIERIEKFAVDVTLDPDTANPQLIVSEDTREVRTSEDQMEVPDHPDRFDLFGSVLGRNRLTDGKAFWVVDVGDKQGWDIGLAREEANRKGAVSLKPSQGYWVIVLYDGDKYAALEDPPTLLSLTDKPQKVGVFVDYLEGLVSFYDVEARSHIYSFTDCVFDKAIRPYFSPHLNQGDKNSSPLVICPVNHSD